MGKSNIYISKCPDITSIFPDDQIYCVYFQMTQLNHSSSQVLGPFLINSSILCFHSSIFPDWTMNTTNHVPDHQQLLQAAVPCPPQLGTNSMKKSLVYFWNMSFTLMIITAVLGNCAVLWIVIRKFGTNLLMQRVDFRGNPTFTTRAKPKQGKAGFPYLD